MLKNSFRPSRILSHKHGFTLVELLVVIVVLGILATITVKIATNVGDSTSEARARADLAVLSTALERYKMKNSDYPHKADNNEVLNALMGFTDPNGKKLRKKKRSFIDTSTLVFTDNWVEQEDISSVPTSIKILDPWDNPYEYEYDRNEDIAYNLYSKGADGLSGSDENDLDNIYYQE